MYFKMLKTNKVRIQISYRRAHVGLRDGGPVFRAPSCTCKCVKSLLNFKAPLFGIVHFRFVDYFLSCAIFLPQILCFCSDGKNESTTG